MCHGSPLCVKLCERIISQFKDNVSQRKIAKNLGISASTVHNIVKSFRESGEISVCKPVSMCSHTRLILVVTIPGPNLKTLDLEAVCCFKFIK